MKNCLLVGIVCLILGFLLRGIIYPNIENMSNKKDSSGIILDIIIIIVIVGILFYVGKGSHIRE
jgi:hypothetical protein